MVIHVAKQQTVLRLVHNDADVAANADGPEIFVLRFVELVKAVTGISRIDLQVEYGCLHSLLFVAGQLREAVGEGIGDSELHQFPGQ